MPLIFDGAGTISGLQAGGLPDSSIISADIANGAITAAKIGYAGAILQVVQTVKTDTFSMTGTTWTTVTGATVNITPSSTSNKILIQGSLVLSNNGSTVTTYAALARSGTLLGIGTAAGNRVGSGGSSTLSSSDTYAVVGPIFLQYLDSPSSTSSLTYQIQVRTTDTNTLYVGRTGDDNDASNRGRFSTIITAMEVAG